MTTGNQPPAALPQKIGDEFLVNTTTPNDQGAPAITSLSDGRFVVTWQDGSGQGGDCSGTSIKAQLFDASGANRAVGPSPYCALPHQRSLRPSKAAPDEKEQPS